jgi:hypothetical protein
MNDRISMPSISSTIDHKKERYQPQKYVQILAHKLIRREKSIQQKREPFIIHIYNLSNQNPRAREKPKSSALGLLHARDTLQNHNTILHQVVEEIINQWCNSSLMRKP